MSERPIDPKLRTWIKHARRDIRMGKRAALYTAMGFVWLWVEDQMGVCPAQGGEPVDIANMVISWRPELGQAVRTIHLGSDEMSARAAYACRRELIEAIASVIRRSMRRRSSLEECWRRLARQALKRGASELRGMTCAKWYLRA